MTTGSPILFLVFNRPETTRRVFEAIRLARPARLYVAADGPRESRPDEAERCAEVRRIATAVDWPCELRTLFRDKNLGCKRAVSSAVTWFFDAEPEGIVLEDDCLPHMSFFPYCDELLARYRDEPEVMCVSGVNFISGSWSPPESYYFSRYSHIWGWASWRRAWQHYDVTMANWNAGPSKEALQKLFRHQPRVARHWHRLFDQVASGRVDTWDYQWFLTCFEHGGLSCLPEVNLISNIGFGKDATHTVSAESKMANLNVSALQFPLRHPSGVAAAAAADEWTNRHVFEIDQSALGIARLTKRLASGLGRIGSAVAR
jgi:hypothetical protein